VFNCKKVFDYPSSNVNPLGVIKTVAAVALLGSTFLTHAESASSFTKNQEVAKNNAVEFGSVVADNHWTRIEFSKVYIDPVVVIEANNADKNTYIAGIRNIDTKGFEVNVKGCDASKNYTQENVNYSVIDNSEASSIAEPSTIVRQRFAWGECQDSSAI
jgi:hypothetical protein